MSSLNKVQLIGRLGQDPEVKHLPGGDAVCNMSVATSEQWKDKNTGDKREKTEWHRVVVFGRLAEICGQYLQKGSMAYFEGKLETRKWQGQDGQDRYTTEVRVHEMKMLSSRQDSQGGGQQQRSAPPPTQQQSRPQQQATNYDDDIPF